MEIIVPPKTANIDDIIDRLRAAHAAGAALDDIAARLHPVIEPEDVSPLLGLETSPPSAIEIMGEIAASSDHGRNDRRLNPLLGTITSSEVIKSSRKPRETGAFCFSGPVLPVVERYCDRRAIAASIN